MSARGQERRRVGSAFGAVLKAARTEAGLTQEELADLAGCDRTFPSQLERGIRTPTISTLLNLAAALGVPAPTLVEQTIARLRGAL